MIPLDLISACKNTLTTGGYNLLLGSGISLDSRNGTGAELAGATALKAELCQIKGVGDSVPLHRVIGLLTDSERSKHLVVPYSNCVAGPSLSPLPSFLWRRAFTFNIDDVLENLYEKAGRRQQSIVPLNFNADFEPTPNRDELLAIHLHGWVREPNAGFVFSYPEYARVMKGQSPWMHLLAQILATESFIIAGTSLNEIDLEYYLSFRNASTPRRGRGPSF
jgi:hypothetical protein